MKRPAFQFYPADWRKDMALQSCSVAARGLWVDLLCIAHECEPYGHLTVNGKPMTAAQIARHTGLTEREAVKLLAELAEAGVSSTTDEGVIYSRRMVRDEDLRNRRAEGGKAGSEYGAMGAEYGIKGGRPPKARGVSEPPLEPPPSSSSSPSSKDISKPTASHPAGPGRAPTVPCPYEAIVDAYHQALPSLPRVRLMPASRQKAMRKTWGWILSSTKSDGTRRAQTTDEALEWLRSYFARASENDFLMGRGPRSAEHAGWQCDLDFLLTDKGMKQVIEKTLEHAA